MSTSQPPSSTPPTTSRTTSRTDPRITGAVGVAEVEALVLERTGLPRVDYVDHFTLAPIAATSPTPTAEQWARALFGDVPSLGQRIIWQGFLQLRLADGRSPLTVAGWRIAEIGEDWIRLETESWALRASLVVHTNGESVSLTTAVHYVRSIGSVVWPPLSAVHRRLIPSLFHPAAAQVTPGPRPSTVTRPDAGQSG